MKRIRKINQIPSPFPTGSTAQVVDIHSTSSANAYSCNYINGLTDYNTTEQVIGKWINNKPLYRRIVQGTIPSVASGQTGNNTIFVANNLDFAIIKGASAYKTSDNSWIDIPFSIESSHICLFTDVSNGNINVVNRKLDYFNNCPIYIIVEYTKTTD